MSKRLSIEEEEREVLEDGGTEPEPEPKERAPRLTAPEQATVWSVAAALHAQVPPEQRREVARLLADEERMEAASTAERLAEEATSEHPAYLHDRIVKTLVKLLRAPVEP